LYLVIVPGGGGLAAALSQHEGDADDLLGLGQVAEHQAAHLCQAVAEGGLDVRICVLVKYKKAFIFTRVGILNAAINRRCMLLLPIIN
jgi:hypothetical protein